MAVDLDAEFEGEGEEGAFPMILGIGMLEAGRGWGRNLFDGDRLGGFFHFAVACFTRIETRAWKYGILKVLDY